jgi:DNA-binding PadR family transcriptional regulator
MSGRTGSNGRRAATFHRDDDTPPKGRNMTNANDEAVARHLPMKPADYLTLVALTDGDLHGYGLVKKIETLSAGTLQLVPGNFYSVLQRLLGEGLLQEAERRAAEDLDDRRRRYYAVTELGRAVAEAETARLKSLVKVAEAHDLAGGRAR